MFQKSESTLTPFAQRLAMQFTMLAAHNPGLAPSLIDSISDGQMMSKRWITEILGDTNLGNVFLCGGWYAMLLTEKRLQYTKCISIDVDPSVQSVAEAIHKELVIQDWKFRAVTSDIMDINYASHLFTFKRANGTSCEIALSPDTIVNTSCEHIANFSAWWEMIPTGKLMVLQSNNGFEIEGHMNCVRDLGDFETQTPLMKTLYSGERRMPKFTRFMRIGYK